MAFAFSVVPRIDAMAETRETATSAVLDPRS